MIHNGIIVDKDPYFTIDPITRVITNESTKKVNIIQFDHNSERFTFSMPRYVEGHDMLECNVVQVHYANIDAATSEQTSGIYEVTDVMLYANDEEKITLSWLLSQNVTQRVGKLEFLVRFVCTDNEYNLDYAWNTAIFSGITISKGMNNTGVIEEQYPDVLAKILADIESMDGMTEQEVNELIREYFKYNDITASFVNVSDLLTTRVLHVNGDLDKVVFYPTGDPYAGGMTLQQIFDTKATEMKLLYKKNITADDGNVSFIEFLPESPLKKVRVYTFCAKGTAANTNKLFFKFGNGTYITQSTGHANIATDSAMYGLMEMDLELHKNTNYASNIKSGYVGNVQTFNNLYPYSGNNTFWTAIYDTTTYEVKNLLSGIKFSTNSESVYFPNDTIVMIWGC